MDEKEEVKVGKYSVEERKDRILRYLKKRNQRNFNKTIKVYLYIYLFLFVTQFMYIYIFIL